jgi:phi13 family phage major tail protein
MAQIGLKEIHYAVLTKDDADTLTYETVHKLAGAISATINPSVNSQEQYADDQLWDSISAMGGVDVEIETAGLELKDKATLLGMKIEEGILVENKDDMPPYIALGFKSLKSDGTYRYVWLLKGSAQPLAEEYGTKKDNVDFRNPKIKFRFMPRQHDGDWKYTADEGLNEFAGDQTWFTKVVSTKEV